MIDLTGVSKMTEAQFVAMSHKLTAVPSLIILYIVSTFFVLPGAYYLMPDGKKNFAKLWISYAIVSLIFLIIFIYNPNFIQSVSNLFLDLF